MLIEKHEQYIEDYLKDLCVIYRGEIGSLPSDDENIARKLYDFAVRKKLERVKEFGIDLTDIYERLVRATQRSS